MTAPAEQNDLLDAALARRQRLSLGLSERDVAKRLGVTGQVIASLERSFNHNELTAAFVSALADVLALPVSAVLATAGVPEHALQAGATPTPGAGGLGVPEDVRVVGALLSIEDTLVPTLTLAAVLGWTPERVLAALTALEQPLAAVGQRLHRLGGDVKVVAAATTVPAATVTALTRRSFARRGMSLSQARLLRRAWLGELTGSEHGNADRVALADLVNAGLLDAPAGTARGTTPGLSADSAFSLGQ